MFPSFLSSSSGRERVLLCFVLLLVSAAVVGPVLPGAAYTGLHFADSRALHHLPNAMDVLSNLPFLLLGVWGLHRLFRIQRQSRLEALDESTGPEAKRQALRCATLFFVGLIVTCAGSVFYHLQPDALRLAADRAGMTVAFAGLIGMAVCDRVSLRAGLPIAGFTLAAGLLAVAAWLASDNLLPWALVQFGGMALVLVLAVVRPLPGALGLRLGGVIACYALAKALEAGDEWVYEATRHVVSGHSLKHLAAALAALPVLHALRGWARPAVRHNPLAVAVTA